MLFNAFIILAVFLLLIFTCYLFPQRFRWVSILVASVLFYIFLAGHWIILLLATGIMAYLGGIVIDACNDKMKKRTLMLFLSIMAIAALVYYKYSDFIVDSVFYILPGWQITGPSQTLLLPLGISFFTFRVLSYLFDIYYGRLRYEKNPLMVILYVMFFPEIIAGPIDRPGSLIPQLRKPADFDYEKVTAGLKLIAWGVFLKVVVADRLGVYVDAVFSSPGNFKGLTLILASFFFTFQIYYDFAGYSLMAIGAGKALGLDLVTNFNMPYYSKSIIEFWRRWHISLSTWFRDYVYIPLGGNRASQARHAFNIMATFLLSGLWHGASWTFVLWGGIHGVYYLFGSLTEQIRNKAVRAAGLDRHERLHSFVKICVIFILVSVAWVFFRTQNVSDSLYIVTHFLSGLSGLFEPGSFQRMFLITQGQNSIANTLALVPLIFFVEAVMKVNEKKNIIIKISTLPYMLRWSLYSGFIMIILLIGRYSQGTQTFIYGRF